MKKENAHIGLRADEFKSFRGLWKKDTDQGCILLAAAYLDVGLQELLKGHFVQDRKLAEELLGNSRPIGSFSARIDLTFLLGLIGRRVHRDLHLVRKIRNICAHSLQPVEFSNREIDQRCNQFYHCVYLRGEVPQRVRFVNTVAALSGIIHRASGGTKHTESPGDMIMDDEFRKLAKGGGVTRGDDNQ